MFACNFENDNDFKWKNVKNESCIFLSWKNFKTGFNPFG